MSDQNLHPSDLVLRGTLTAMIAELGYAPSSDVIASRVGKSAAEVEAGLHRLHLAHALLLHPGSSRPWVVHPFALSPGSCWVQTPDTGYWANCLYCGFGIAASLRCDAVITTRYGGEAETVRYVVTEGQVQASGDVFHLSTPVQAWWDNVIHACASFQPFRTEADAADWCRRHDFPKGASMSIPALWSFAQDWYGAYLTEPWRKRAREDVMELFERHGLTTEFWRI
jgi:hypothetical protein